MPTPTRAPAGAAALMTSATASSTTHAPPFATRTIGRRNTGAGRRLRPGAPFVFIHRWTARSALVSGRSLAEVRMEIEARRFMELAIHVKLASEAVLEAARNLATLQPDAAEAAAGPWRRAMDELIALNVELGFMERILRTTATVSDPLDIAARG